MNKNIANVPEHPMEKLLRMDRIPHIWCSTCGIGTAVSCFIQALENLEYPLDKIFHHTTQETPAVSYTHLTLPTN